MTAGPQDFQITSHFYNNAIFIIDALSPDDSPTGEVIYHALQLMVQVSQHHRPTVKRICVTTPDQMLDALESIRWQCKFSGIKPLVHIESHGDDIQGIKVGTHMMSWKTLERALGKINKACRGDLAVIMGACFGLYAISGISIKKASPFYFLAGPDKPIGSAAVRQETLQFYQALLASGDLQQAVAKLTSMQAFYAEKLLARALAQFYRQACLGSKGRDRVERYISEFSQARGGFANRAQLRAVRQKAKAHVRRGSHQETFNRFTTRFLPYKKCSFKHEDLLSWAREVPVEFRST